MKKPHQPEFLPLDNLDNNLFAPLIGRANAALGRYDGFLQGMINPDVLLSPLTTQEAVFSSRIEGSVATLEAVLEAEAQEEIRNDDIQEVFNYRQSLRMATQELRTRPISLNLIKRIHEILLDSVRGRDKGRGFFRRTQNFIGIQGTTIDEASFIPPEPQMVLKYLDNWEKYIHNETRQDVTVVTALSHAQFEMIHPFLDGNGRVGRILIPLQLYQSGVLSSPNFYMSAYLEKNRDEYIRRLQAVSEKGDWQGWIVFFLQALISQAGENLAKARAIRELYEETKIIFSEKVRSRYSLPALDALFDRVYFSSSQFSERSEIPTPTSLAILKKLEKAKVIQQLRPGRGRRPALWVFGRLFNLAEGKNIF